ncbi:MAG: hypothetical protein KDD64_08215 [Bdellovibrionales bacterium]|nr:hypothetical protein [Bdellovibrionales bacterium]
MSTRFYIFCILFFFLPLTLCAEDPASGRLPDGRAFRTDGEGNQIVDYIAELEMTVTALKRRVQGLEDEVARSQGGAVGGSLEEKDLLSASEDAENEAIEARGTFEAINARESNRGNSACEQKLQIQKSSLAQLSERALSQQSSCNDQIRALKTQMRSLELRQQQVDLIERNATDQQRNFQSLAAELQEARTRGDSLEAQLSQKSLELQTVQSQFGERERKLGEIISTLKREKESLQSSLTQVKVESRPSSSSGSLVRARLNDDALSASRSKAVQSFRMPLLEEIGEVRKAAATRDQAFRTFKRSDIRLSPQKLVSRRGLTLGRLEKLIKSADSVEEIALYRRDLHEIASKVKQDLQTIKRMKQL